MNTLRIAFLPVLLLLSGCLPEERIWWSPQGDIAVVATKDSVHLATADGHRGSALNVQMEDALYKSVSWLRDGSGFVAQRTRVVTKWDELRDLVPNKELEAVEAMLPIIIPLLEAMAGMGDEMEKLAVAITGSSEAPVKRFELALHRKFEQEPERIEKLLLALPDGAKTVASYTKAGAGYELNELCLFQLDGDSVKETKSFAASLLRPALMPRVSPRHDALAFLQIDDDGESATLEVSSLDGGTQHRVARKVSGAFDWTPDGRALVFMAPLGGEGEKLQSIYRVTIIEEDGTLTDPGKPTTLAMAVSLNRPALQVLADGRVLFASQPVTLPSMGSGPELAPRLYLIAADDSAVTPIPTAPGDLPTNLGFFTASPDGRHVAVVESETDAVAVVEVDTGKTQIISLPHPRWQCRTLPAWKSADELTFAALHEGAPAWMLWREGAPLRCISESWPKSSTANWLQQQSEDSADSSVISKPAPTR